jgi:hypothetical protein
LDQHPKLQAWKNSDLSLNKDWILSLSKIEQKDLLNEFFFQEKSQMTVDSPFCNYLCKKIIADLSQGFGVSLVRALPTTSLTLEENKRFLLWFGSKIGLVNSQIGTTPEISEVKDEGNSESPFYYNRAGALPMHMDPVDVVGLLCLQPATSGGLSGMTSSLAVYDAFKENSPALLSILMEGFAHLKKHKLADRESKQLTEPVPIFYQLNEQIICTMVPHVIESAVASGLLNLTKKQQNALSEFQRIALDPELHYSILLQKGDLQLLNNRVVLHNRTTFRNHSDPTLARLLLRLWVTMPDWAKLPKNIPHKDAQLLTDPA